MNDDLEKLITIILLGLMPTLIAVVWVATVYSSVSTEAIKMGLQQCHVDGTPLTELAWQKECTCGVQK